MENGFADFLCNKEFLREFYKEIKFVDMDIVKMDLDLTTLSNLEVLKLSKNFIKIVFIN